MRIGIDANHLSVIQPTGIRNYTKNLIYNLSEIDHENDYFIFVSKKVEIPIRENFHLITSPRIYPTLKRQFFLSYFVHKEKVDIFHYLNPYGDVFLDHPKIITTVQDTNLDQIYPWSFKYFFNRLNCELTRKVIFEKTKVFITSSSTVKRELRQNFKSAKYSENIFVTPYAASTEFKLSKRFKSKRSGFLCLSDFSERKNTERIIKAFGKLPQKIRRRNKLIIVSTSKKSAAVHMSLLKNLNLEVFSEIMYDIPDNKLSELYNRSVCFLYPSLYEGFGLPILESMACGCPVITSNYGAMKEIAGNAALFVNPTSVDEINKQMIKVAEGQKLIRRLSKAGLQRSKIFSWKKCAQETLNIYKDVYKRS